MANAGINPKYAGRIEKLKEKLLTTYPEIDLEDAKILTESFLEKIGRAHV